MTSTLRRAGGFAAVATLTLATPVLGPLIVAPFAAIAVLAAVVVDEGELFELFARPGDRQDGRLNGLAAFCLTAAALAFLTTLNRSPLPTTAFVATVLVVGYGNLGAEWVKETTRDEFLVTAGFAVTGFAAALAGGILVTDPAGMGWPFAATEASVFTLAFHAAVAALVAALVRSVLFERDDPMTLSAVGVLLWVLSSLVPSVAPADVGIAIAATLLLGYAAYATGTASVPGLLTGVLLCLLTIVLGGLGWFVVLVTFYGGGAIATKFKYETKLRRGVAEENEGARGSSNVLGNTAVGLAAVLGFAASETLGLPGTPFALAFAGSIATAMADTLSSELGGLFDTPRLVTTLEPVPPGTDGGVTWQGELAGLSGSLLVGLVAGLLMPVSVAGAALVALGGVVGMTVDSLVGATLEGDRIENEAVNFLATLAGALTAVLGWLVVGSAGL